MPWYALYTRPRHEKKVYSFLIEKDFIAFLPLRERVKQWKDRKMKIEVPLFSSYVFSDFNYRNRFEILETQGIIKIIHFHGKPAVIPDWQIDSLKKMLESPATLRLESYVRLGEMVEVMEGPFKGLRGMVDMRKNEHRLILTLDGIMQSVSVEIDVDNVKKVKIK
jgi:transcription antitermination factor NusG